MSAKNLKETITKTPTATSIATRCCNCAKEKLQSWKYDKCACDKCKKRQQAMAAAASACAASNEAARLIQVAKARAEQITADEQANADRITTARQADAQLSAGAAQAEAQRITADARAAAQRITAAAQAAAQAAAHRGPGEGGLNTHESGRTSVVIFFYRYM
jgi:hypothetical protein